MAARLGSPALQSRLNKRVRATLHEPLGGERTAAARVEVAASARVDDELPLTTPVDTATAFRRYAGYVAAIGMRVLGRRDEIEDFVQDVFLAAHRSLAAVREPAALKGWLATLAVREAVRRLKRRRLREWLGIGSAVDYGDVADHAASSEERALLASVFAALDKLPTAERVAWALRYLEGETMERVAELAGCSLSTAKRRVAAAELALEKVGVGRG
jgi:RNA polymerase sigma-70 factor, ECF subfamily